MKELSAKYNPSEVEDKWYAKWMEKGFFHSEPDEREPYTIVIPPPNVTGILHMGHVLNNTLNDVLIRKARMDGKNACWVPGTDHASIATESKVVARLKEQGISKEDLTREEFLRYAWEWKEEHGGIILKQLRKLGASCDWDRTRFTMDPDLSDAVISTFVYFYKKGLIYRGVRMVNWDPVGLTAVSDEEVIHKDTQSKFYHLRYYVSDGNGNRTDKYIVVATTRPETIMADAAVSINPDDERYDWLKGKKVLIPLINREIPIIEDSYVEIGFGTGCLKVTPAHDANDYAIGLRHNLPITDIIDDHGRLNENAVILIGEDRFVARKKIEKMLAEEGLLEKVEDYVSPVGYSERTDAVIEPKLSTQWFLKMEDLAKVALESVESGRTKLIPDKYRNTYRHWMENVRDWCISRQLWWGQRIPAWYLPDGTIVVEETAEKALEAAQKINPALSAADLRQDEDVLDTWFSSWLWPISVFDPALPGHPEKKPNADLAYYYPTNDLVTGPDILFFWVARMIMAGDEFLGKEPFSNVYLTGIVRDKIGRKMSKTLGNSPDPLDLIAKYGADALRFSIVYIAPVGMDIRYSNEKCELGRNFANKLWNACRFRTMQGPVSASFDKLAIPVEKLTHDELHMLNTLEKACADVNTSLREFRFHSAAHDIYELVWNNFCDWFIEACKPRFNADDAAKQQALAVLDYALWKLLRLLHPFMPFITEELAHRMGFLADGQSIMTAAFPVADLKLPADVDKISEMTADKYALISAGRNLRLSNSIPPGKRIEYHIRAASQEISDSLCAQMDSLTAMLNASLISISLENYASEDGTPAPSIVCDAGAIFLPLKGLVDPAAEREKLTKQKAELIGWIKAAEAKLNNEKFVSRAPAKVVEDVKTQLADLKDKLARVEESLAAFKG